MGLFAVRSCLYTSTDWLAYNHVKRSFSTFLRSKMPVRELVVKRSLKNTSESTFITEKTHFRSPNQKPNLQEASKLPLGSQFRQNKHNLQTAFIYALTPRAAVYVTLKLLIWSPGIKVMDTGPVFSTRYIT